jgi:hypothetical protein
MANHTGRPNPDDKVFSERQIRAAYDEWFSRSAIHGKDPAADEVWAKLLPSEQAKLSALFLIELMNEGDPAAAKAAA